MDRKVEGIRQGGKLKVKKMIFRITYVGSFLACLLILMVVGNIQAKVIDSFNNTNQLVMKSIPNLVVPTAAGESIGGYRTMDFISQTQSGDSSTLEANPNSRHVLALSNNVFTKSAYKITWDANGYGFDQDITDSGLSTHITLVILSIDVGGINFTFTVTDTSGNVASRTITNAGKGTYNEPFSNFTNNPGNTRNTDFKHVKIITLELNTLLDSADLSVDLVGTWGPPPPPSSLSGYVYVDSNNNGFKDLLEAPIPNVTVTLTGTDSYGNAVSLTTTTDANGLYNFTNLIPGTYTITEKQPAGYFDGKDTQGTPGTGTTGDDAFSNITLSAGINGQNNNFGELLPSSISGYVYVDANSDSVFNPGELPIARVTVTLNGTDDLGNPVSRTETTNASGLYNFPDLRPGTYTITETQPDNYLDGKDSQGTPGTGTTGNDAFSNITLSAGTNGQNNNFGELLPASISGYVYVDANNDGVKDSGEASIPGVTVTLTGTDDFSSPVSLSTTTDTNGLYNFTNLRPGTYVITETQPSGYLDGKDTIGTPGGTTANDIFSNIVLGSGVNGTNNNFGELMENPSIDVEKYVSSDNTTWDDADNPPGISVASGGNVYFKFVVTNTGNVTLTNITLTDNIYTIPTESVPASLAAGASFTIYLGPLPSTAGQHTNTATVEGDYDGKTYTDKDDANYFGTQAQGLTPGYWKNHPEKWVDYTPDTKVFIEVFSIPKSLLSSSSGILILDLYGGKGGKKNGDGDNDTLMDALNYKGGSDLGGAVQILLRAAVAALLNAAHPQINYTISEAQTVIDKVNAVLATENRDTILALATELDNYNNKEGVSLAPINQDKLPDMKPEQNLVPNTTRLLNNYPNPFNPETWIPYELGKAADVKILINDVTGRLVRTLNLGYKAEGYYVDRTKAAHWDGTNEAGEKATSGIYFYTIEAGDLTDTKMMVIQK